MSRTTLNQWVNTYIRGSRKTQVRPSLTRRTALEQLGERITPTVNAMFGGSVLTIYGDNADNTITVSRTAAGNLLVNGGAVAILGTAPTVANTSQITMFG